MENTPEEFIEWSLHPDRTLEERFGIEILLEKAEHHFCREEKISQIHNFEADRLRHKARFLDPAYRPTLKLPHIQRASLHINSLAHLSLGIYEDRPLRDISFLRFCPSLTNLSISNSEIADFSPISALTSLRTLSLIDGKARDYRPLASLTSLESLHLHPQRPWPDLRGFENLTNLSNFNFTGNILALQPIPILPALRHAQIKHGYKFNIPLRSLADLPEMPELRTLELVNTDSLEGIARYPLLNLDICGYFEDLTPLADLESLTHLFLSGEDFDITPVSRLPSLLRLTIRTSFPPDLTPLADSPRLHEILLKDCPVVPAELASLNSLAPSWDGEFAAAEKRPLKPLRLLIRKPHAPGQKRVPQAIPGLIERGGEDTELGKSEYRWFVRKVNRRLTKLLGKSWRHVDRKYSSSPGYLQIPVTKSEHIDRLPEIVTVLRKCFASARHRWTALLIVNSLAEYERDMDEIAEDDPDVFDAESERQEWEYHRKRKQEREDFLRRKYLHQLSQETGIQQPSATPGEPAPAPEPAGPADSEEPEYDLGTKLELYATLTETSAIIHRQDLDLAEMLFETKAEPGEWLDETF